MSTERRSFLRASLMLGTAACVFSATAEAVTEKSTAPDRTLRLANVHTGEILDVVYWADGRYISDHLGQLNYFMRDHHSGTPARMHIRLYENLFRLQSALDTNSRIHILSAFRTSATNEALRKRITDVARNSYHVKGRAADFYIPGIDNEVIQSTARELKLGGVGYYTRRHFVHIDTGRPRFWIKS